MITKAIITSVITEYRVKVRVPIYDRFDDVANATPTQDLSEAIICTMPGINIIPAVGDIVIVGFEENIKEKPVILGFLYSKNGIRSISNYKVDNLSIGRGEISSKVDVEELNQTIASLREAIQSLQQEVESLKGQINS